MPYMRNKDTAAVIGPMTDDSAEYLYLQALRDGSGRPQYEDVGTQEAGTASAAQSETRQALMDSVTIAADAEATITKAPAAGTVSKVEYFPVAAVTGAASPASRTLSVVNKGQSGSGTTVVASLALLSGVNLVEDASNAITLSGTPGNLVVAAGDVLEWKSTHVGGTGLVDPGGLVVVTFTRD